MSRMLPLASDRDRISAARYTMLKLENVLQGRKRRRPRWSHWITLHGSIISERSQSPAVPAGAVTGAGSAQ